MDAVLSRPEVLRKLRATPTEARALLALLRRRATVVHPGEAVRLCRDPADDKFLECAVAAGADYLVSADEDLLMLQEVQGIPIVSAPVFWNLLEQGESGE